MDARAVRRGRKSCCEVLGRDTSCSGGRYLRPLFTAPAHPGSQPPVQATMGLIVTVPAGIECGNFLEDIAGHVLVHDLETLLVYREVSDQGIMYG